jgi:hypothetical protein
MPELKLVRRWGQHGAGETVDVSDTEAKWLVANHYASEDGSDTAARAGARAPGSEGADLRAGGDWSRGGGMQVVRGPRGTAPEEADNNRAASVKGAPRAGDPVYQTPAEIEAKREQKKIADEHRAELKKQAEEGEKQRESARKGSEKQQAEENKPQAKKG